MRASRSSERTVVRSSLLALCFAMISAPAFAQTGAIALVKAGTGVAVIRAGTGPLQMVRVGDRIGSTKALVTHVGAGRIVLEEMFTDADGKPNRALIVIREGETGGTRYLRRPGTPKPPVTPARSPRKP